MSITIKQESISKIGHTIILTQIFTELWPNFYLEFDEKKVSRKPLMVSWLIKMIFGELWPLFYIEFEGENGV